jgi:hypothetical protein
MNILENIKPCGKIPIWQKTLITSPQVVLKKIYTIFFFAREIKTQNPPRYIPSKPYQKNPNYQSN